MTGHFISPVSGQSYPATPLKYLPRGIFHLSSACTCSRALPSGMELTTVRNRMQDCMGSWPDPTGQCLTCINQTITCVLLTKIIYVDSGPGIMVFESAYQITNAVGIN